MSPWGGAEPFFGTNPISIAVPDGSGEPVVLDMSSSVVARGKIRRAERMKEPIPSGWAFDANGDPTTDPSAAMKGTLMPIGGPKVTVWPSWSISWRVCFQGPSTVLTSRPSINPWGPRVWASL